MIMFACVTIGETLLIGSFGFCLDMVGSVWSALDNRLSSIQPAIISVTDIAFQPINQNRIIYFHYFCILRFLRFHLSYRVNLFQV